MAEASLTRHHRNRLMNIWRSAGWPCKDAIEIDLLAAGWVRQEQDAQGRETLKLSDSGIALLAEARHKGQRALTPHDRLAQRMAEHLLSTGRIVWRELELRAQVPVPSPADGEVPGQDLPPLSAHEATPLWAEAGEGLAPAALPRPQPKNVWRMARPDVFSVRNTSVENYLHPVVHEVKHSRADLLSDLRHAAKRQSYQWLCSECYYVFPAGVAKANEIPSEFGIWLLHGAVEDGQLELHRPARHNPCTLPFAVWLALAKASPLRLDSESLQARLGEGGGAQASPGPTQAPL